MPASFALALDTTTSIDAAINGGNAVTSNTTVTLELTLEPDAALVKVWGDINPLDPGSPGFGETEAGAEWIEASPSFLVNITTAPGAKTLHVKVRDDVDNEASAESSIILEGGGPPPTPPPVHPAARPAQGPPRRRPESRRRLVLTGGPAGRTRDHAAVLRAGRSLDPVGSGLAASAQRTLVASSSAGPQLLTRVQSNVAVRIGPKANPGATDGFGRTELRRRDGEVFIAGLAELGIL